MHEQRFKGFWPPVVGVAALLSTWSAVVLVGADGFNPLGLPQFDFERAGLFGESFGFPVALLAAVATIFTYCAFVTTRDENRRLREDQTKRDKADRRRETEQTFFRLMELRLAIVRDIQINDTLNEEKYEGTDALNEMYIFIRGRLQVGQEDREQAYAAAYDCHRNNLGH